MADLPDGRRDYRRIVGMDPAANWLLGPALGDFVHDPGNPLDPNRPCIAFLIEFGDQEAVEAFENLGPMIPTPATALAEPKPLGNGALILGVPEDELREGSLAMAIASPDWFERLLDGSAASERFRKASKRIALSSPASLLEPLLETAPNRPLHWKCAPTRTPPKEPTKRTEAWDDGNVIVAVIDDGIAFAHERLRNKDGSRVAFFWDMNGPLPLAQHWDLVPPGELPGELSREEIDELIEESEKVGGLVDEDRVYQQAGLVDYRSPLHKAAGWRVAHGAHVLDLAAGADPEQDVRNRPVIAVQLPSPVVARTNNDYLADAYIWLAILYVLDRADRLTGPGRKPRLVINVSFGYIAGPHDGSGLLETHMDKVIESRAPFTQIVLAAGNSHLSRCHGVVDLAAADPVEFDWVVQPGDRTHSLLQVWLPAPDDPEVNRLTLTVTTPEGRAMSVAETATNDASTFGSLAGARGTYAYLYAAEHPTADNTRRLFELWIMPTERLAPSERPVASPGSWRLSFEPTGAGKGEAHVWVQRDDSLYGYPQAGRQAYLEHPDYKAKDANGREIVDEEDLPPPLKSAPVRRKSLTNAIATGQLTITAGGFVEQSRLPARYSAGGPNTPPESGRARPTKPDALLPSEGSKAHRGVLAAGARSGGRVTMNGTSVAAPQLTRWVADALGGAMPLSADRPSVAAFALGFDQPGEPKPPPDRGAGRLPRRDPLEVKRYE